MSKMLERQLRRAMIGEDEQDETMGDETKKHIIVDALNRLAATQLDKINDGTVAPIEEKKFRLTPRGSGEVKSAPDGTATVQVGDV